MNSFPTDFNNERRFDFQSAAAGCSRDTFAVVEMSGEESISQPYRFDLVLVSMDERLDLDAVLGAPACLRILGPVVNGVRVGDAAPYHGMLAEFEQLEKLGAYTFYRAQLVPRLWALSQYRNSEVYLHERSITEIIKEVLDGVPDSLGLDYTLSLTADYRPRSYVCQYQESPLDFISRWMEREGIYYHFEQVTPVGLDDAMGHEKLVLLDARIAQPAQARAVAYRPAGELDVGLSADSIHSFVCRTRRLPKAVVLQDFNYRRAGLPLQARAEVSANGLGEEMLYGENFRSPEEGERYARIRAQELLCGGQVFSGNGTAMGLRSGRFMDLSLHYRSDFDGRYFITRVTHAGSQAGALLAGMSTPYNRREGRTHYSNSFETLREQVQFRAPRTTPRPRVAGTMTATIDAEGSGEYAELDEYGQYKVQVPFDRTDKPAAKGSARIRMATPYSGSDHGMHFPLLKGAEVLLSFADGDPDQPVITGAVPNSLNPSVIDHESAHDNLISTKGGNQLLMKDTQGKEVIWLNSPFHKSSIGVGSIHPDGGGSIFEATSGGKDAVSFGVNNSMSFGSANSLKLGTQSSISGSFSNDVSWGAKVGINASSSINWNMNTLGPLAWIKSLSIDDSDKVDLTRKHKGSSVETAVIEAGALPHELSNAKLSTSLGVLRGVIAGATALNFTQSTIFGMAVNGSDNDALVAGAAKKRAADDEAQAKWQAEEDAQKWKDQKAVDTAEPPEDVKGEEAVKKWRNDEKARLDKTYADRAEAHKLEQDPWLKSETGAKKAELEALDKKTPPEGVDKDNPIAVQRWKAAEKKAVDDKYAARAKAHAAPSRKAGLSGWPGIVGKFGLDFGLNVASVAAIQGAMRLLTRDLNALKLVSRMELGATGIVQSVNGEKGPDGAGSVRTEIRMSPASGIGIKAASRKKWGAGDQFAEGTIEVGAHMVLMQAEKVVALTAPVGSLKDRSTGTGLSYSSSDDTASLSTKDAQIVAQKGALFVVGKKIEVGHRPTMHPMLVAATAKFKAADVADQAAGVAFENASAARATARESGLSDNDIVPMVEAVASTMRAKDQTRRALAEAQAELVTAQATFTVPPQLNGLTVTDKDAALTFGMAGWKVSNDGVSISLGGAKAEFKPVGLQLDGQLLKLG